jgi:Peptidase family M3
MATVFEKAKDGYLDKQAGMKLRHEIYEPGDSRDVNVSIEKLLGRKQSVQPFLKKIGIGPHEKRKRLPDHPKNPLTLLCHPDRSEGPHKAHWTIEKSFASSGQ